MQAWLYLLAAILCEVAGTTSMKLSEGFSKVVPSVMIFVFYSVSFVALTLAIKKIDLSIAYAVWSGIGTALIAVIGVLYFQETITFIKVGSFVLIIVGVIGLNIAQYSP